MWRYNIWEIVYFVAVPIPTKFSSIPAMFGHPTNLSQSLLHIPHHSVPMPFLSPFCLQYQPWNLYILALIGYNHVTLPKPSHLHVNEHHVTWLSHMVHRELADWKKYKKIEKDVIYYCSTFCISLNHQHRVTTPRKYRIVHPIPATITALFQHSQLLCQSRSYM